MDGFFHKNETALGSVNMAEILFPLDIVYLYSFTLKYILWHFFKIPIFIKNQAVFELTCIQKMSKVLLNGADFVKAFFQII